MKLLTTIVFAAVLALSSTFALAYTGHHRTYHHGYHHGYNSYGQYNRGYRQYNRGYGQYNRGYSQYYGSPNNRGGLVGGSDAGTYRP
jgi:hypothetical protein